MKIVSLFGGLGNQMFDYAFSLALKKQYPNEDILLDAHLLNTLYEYGFELHTVFPDLEYKLATKKQVNSVSRYFGNYYVSRFMRSLLPTRKSEFIERIPDGFDSEVYNQNGDRYYIGYWHGFDYYKDIIGEIQDSFVFKNPNGYNESMGSEMAECNSVGIHVRRGDYLKAKHAEFGQAITLDYYKDAISLLYSKNENYRFYIFSNDIEWCKQEILPLLKTGNVTFMTENTGINSCWDMYLMSKCKNLIIANSTFSWWGAILNRRNPMVIAPKNWKVDYPSDTICSPLWIRL